MKNHLVVRDNNDQILIVDYTKALTDTYPDSDHYGTPFFQTGESQDYFDIHIHSFNGTRGESQRLLSEWQTVSKNQNFVNPSVTVFEICTEETRYRVTRNMPDWVVCYVDYIDPLKDRASAPVEMQYINRRLSDGALWPTPFQVVAAGWEQIASHHLNGRHEVGDTVLIHDRSAKPENALRRGTIAEVMADGSLLLSDFRIEFIERCINFSKGDHLSKSEREAWEAEAAGY